MSDLAKEVAAELQGAGLSWWQRASLIVAANVLGLVLGAIVIAAGGIVWNKAMSTDDIKEQLEEHVTALKDEINKGSQVAAAERTTIIDELSNLGVEHTKFRELVDSYHEDDDSHSDQPDLPTPDPGIPSIPIPDPPPPQQTGIREPSASEVRDRKAAIQQRIDKEIYRVKERGTTR